MNCLEQYYIQKIAKQDLHLNNSQIDYYNPIFNVLNKHFK
jgi:hypothetical protein